MKRWLCLYECRKLTASRFLWLLCAVLLAANTAICWFNTPQDTSAALLDSVWEQYRADPEEMEAYAARLEAGQQAEMQKQFEAFGRGEVYTPQPDVCTFDPSGELSDLALIGRVKSRALADSKYMGWRTGVSRVISAAAANKREPVGTIQNGDDGVLLRILAEGKPTETAIIAAPTLEDYYLWVFGDIL